MSISADILFPVPSLIHRDSEFLPLLGLPLDASLSFIKRPYCDILIVFDIVDFTIPPDSYKLSVLVITEPLEYSTLSPLYIRQFDHVLAFDKKSCDLNLLPVIPKHLGYLDARNVLPLSSVIDTSVHSTKSSLVSILSSPKRFYYGHRARLRFIEHLSSSFLINPDHIFGITNRLIDKQDAFTSFKFSIIFENSLNPYYTSEKIFDCLLCHTVPIYFGSYSPLIATLRDCIIFLDPSSFTVDDLQPLISSLDDSLYYQYLPHIKQQLPSILDHSSSYFYVYRILRFYMFHLNHLQSPRRSIYYSRLSYLYSFLLSRLKYVRDFIRYSLTSIFNPNIFF